MGLEYLVIDLETGCKEYLGRKGSFLKNDIVAIGLKYHKLQVRSLYSRDGFFWSVWKNILQDVNVLVGHNLKYDLLYIWKAGFFQDWLKNGGRIWDTQLAEYIISGQRHKYPALRDIAVNKYGCKEREKKMEEYWDKGIDTKDIPQELVLEDVTNDVLDTEAIMLQQVKIAKKEKMYDLIMEQMEGLLATCDMEYNGIFLDKLELNKNKQVVEQELKDIYNQLEDLSNQYYK